MEVKTNCRLQGVDPLEKTMYLLIKQPRYRLLSDVELTVPPNKPFVTCGYIKALLML